MQRPDDLIGLYREVDKVFSTTEPPAGQAARLRSRLAAEIAPRRHGVARAVVFAAAVLVVGMGLWTQWKAPPTPEATAPFAPVPSASGEIVAEPRLRPELPLRSEPSPAPTSSSFRWLPRRPLPALPILPPHSELAPVRAPGPFPAPLSTWAPTEQSRARPRRLASDSLRAASESTDARADVAPPRRAPDNAHGPGLPAMGSLTVGPRSSHSQPALSDSDGNDPEQADSEDEGEPCIEMTAGADGICYEVEKLTYFGTLACASKGFALSSIHPVLDCPGGMSTSAQALCCGSAAPEEETTSLPPKCEFFLLGDGASCASTASLETEAEVICGSMGMTVSTLAPVLDCPDGESTLAKATCCSSPVSEPVASDPSSEPIIGTLGDGTECTPDSVLLQQALDLCKAEGMMLLDCTGIQDCGPGVSSSAKYVCVP